MAIANVLHCCKIFLTSLKVSLRFGCYSFPESRLNFIKLLISGHSSSAGILPFTATTTFWTLLKGTEPLYNHLDIVCCQTPQRFANSACVPAISIAFCTGLFMHATLPLKSVVCQLPKVFANTPKKRKDIFTMNLAERFKAAREAGGYSQEELAKKVGVAQQTINKIENGIIRNPRKLSLIESVLGLPVGYLMYGEDAEAKMPSLPQPVVARCPVLPWEKAIEWPANRNEVLRDNKIEALAQKIILGSNCYALRVNNDAMKDSSHKQSFSEDSYIIVDPDVKFKSGSLVIAVENSKGMLFRKYIKEGSREYLFAYNSKYEPVKLDETLKICGVVVAHLDVLI
jgi:SOS-response transcriptional repressor LexA